MKTRLLIIGLSIAGIFGGLYTANVIKNIEDQKAQEEWRELREDLLSEIKKNKTDSGWIADEDIEHVWVLLPVTSCGYPWHESNHEKTKQYFVEYRNIFGNYDSSDPFESVEAMHYVITRYYEDLGKDILDVRTSADHSMPVMGEGCNTTVGAKWHLKIQNPDLAYFLDQGYIEQEVQNEN